MDPKRIAATVLHTPVTAVPLSIMVEQVIDETAGICLTSWPRVDTSQAR